jgi:phosphatidylinositol alpha-1,6-mannosyltransferase
MRLLVLLMDAFGGRGEIAQCSRATLQALCSHPDMERVVTLPRTVVERAAAVADGLPARLEYRTAAASGTTAYLREVLRTAASPFDGVVCAHVDLLPFAVLAALRGRMPLLLVAYGSEAWRAPRRAITRWSMRRVDAAVSLSELTRFRLLAWSSVSAARTSVVPPCVDIARLGSAPRRGDLVDRHGLAGRTVLLTLARLASAARDEGVDRVLGVLPALGRDYPELVYLVTGDGDDRPRLEALASSLGVHERVLFVGAIAEEDKADYCRIADALVMPGWGECFGIACLEALACGIPVVASISDANLEMVRDGELGELVDPDDPGDIVDGIRRALARPAREPHPGLEHFAVARFNERWTRVVDEVFGARDHEEGE